MKIALIGYGAMGKIVERLAVERGHEISAVVDEASAGLSAEEIAEKLAGSDSAIDFTVANAVRRNVEACMLAKVPVAVGTTGWNDQRVEIEELVASHGGGMVFGANFSIGVNLFYRIADFAAELFAKFPEYEVFIEEQHHSRKKDAPSGTALKLKEIVETSLNKKNDVPVASTRAGNIPGTHRVGFDGPADQILLEHTARSREGFAAGAITAAEWIAGKSGTFEFTDVIGKVLGD
ncbi:MAG: 4-hydroxy-tetrahydrodipicolinate reductase [Acidobacteria bacterium]|nr:4-hydroxy-tetrahydrodipicolinate reductase [Acidobacteriota bacterium]